jgi:hypothetical protein
MTRIAGRRPQPEREVLSIDYADVLAQAIANERWRVLREVRRGVEAVPTSTPDKFDSWKSNSRNASEVKADILRTLSTIEEKS